MCSTVKLPSEKTLITLFTFLQINIQREKSYLAWYLQVFLVHFLKPLLYYLLIFYPVISYNLFQIPGRLKLTNQAVIFKNSKTGKVEQIQATEIESISKQRIAATPGLRLMLKNGSMYRFGGFNETVSSAFDNYITLYFCVWIFFLCG